MKRVTPEEAAVQMATEDHIIIVFSDGFDEFSKTAQEFKGNIIAEEQFEELLVDAFLGGEYRYETFLNNSRYTRNSVIDIVKYGEWSYILLLDHQHRTDSNRYVGIENLNRVEVEEERLGYPPASTIETTQEASSNEEIRLFLDHKESFSILSMVGGCIDEGRIQSNYEVNRIESLIKSIESESMEEFKEGLEFEVQIVVRRREQEGENE
jgi:hypothetical protein